MPKILIFDSSHEFAIEARIILKLIGCHTTVVTTVEEAVNWIRVEKSLSERFDFFVFGAIENNTEQRWLLKELEEIDTVILIYLQRDRNDRPAIAKENMMTCQLNELASCVRKCLPPVSHPAENERRSEDA